MPRCFYGCGVVVRMTLPYGKLCSRELGYGELSLFPVTL